MTLAIGSEQLRDIKQSYTIRQYRAVVEYPSHAHCCKAYRAQQPWQAFQRTFSTQMRDVYFHLDLIPGYKVHTINADGGKADAHR
jgi:hypothetical protein